MLGEAVALSDALGGAAVLAGVGLVMRPARSRRPAPSPGRAAG